MRTIAISLSGVYLSALAFTSVLIPVQTATAAPLEEVVVTARKRQESLQDVPISVQAIAGEQIAEQGLVDIQQIAPYTPNFSYIKAAGASDLYFMRGLGTFGSGVHFEPSVGQVFNGFFSTRSRLGRGALIDVAQVEVLKGPQGAIIGKNASLGAINIRSNKPTEEFESSLSIQYNFDASEGYEIEGMVSGPLTDRIRGRAVVNYRDVDGWIKNSVTGNDLQQKEDLTTRVMFDIDLTDSVTVELMEQHSDLDREGKARIILGCLEFDDPAPSPPSTIAGTEAATGFDCSGIDDRNVTADIRRKTPTGTPFNSKEPFTITSDLIGVTVTIENENSTITSLSAWNFYNINDTFSGDQTSKERVSIQNAEDYEQFYQELRIDGSTPSGLFDYIAGAMFFRGNLDASQSFHAIAGAIGPPVPPINPAVSRNEFQASDTDSQALFGQVDYHFNDKLTLTFGGRVTHEEREGSKAQQVGEVYTSNLANAPVPCDTPTVPLSACTHGNDGLQPGGTPITGVINETNFSYNASWQYAFNDEHKLYFTAATGFKSGGFDLRGAGNPAKFIFGKEKSFNYEIGGKHTFLDDSLRFNWTLYRTEVNNLQVSANDPVLIQQIVSSADATSDGVEVDLLWATPLQGLRLNFTGAYTDAEYDRFTGSCYLSQVETGSGCTNVSVANGQRTGLQNLKGQRLPLAPEYSFVVGGDYTLPLPGNMQAMVSAKYIYIDDQFMSIERDPLGHQGSTDRVDASIVLSGNVSGGHPWTLALIGRNLNNEKVFTFVNSSTLSGKPIVTSNLEETRSISLRASIGY
ncbi:MAG: TonB-dependent receptor [Gammaproteobacteria bacterium]